MGVSGFDGVNIVFCTQKLVTICVGNKSSHYHHLGIKLLSSWETFFPGYNLFQGINLYSFITNISIFISTLLFPGINFTTPKQTHPKLWPKEKRNSIERLSVTKRNKKTRDSKNKKRRLELIEIESSLTCIDLKTSQPPRNYSFHVGLPRDAHLNSIDQSLNYQFIDKFDLIY
jgi:hypothetical protein